MIYNKDHMFRYCGITMQAYLKWILIELWSVFHKLFAVRQVPEFDLFFQALQ